MRFLLYPSSAQEVLLLEQCGHARYVWNLGLEQPLMWRRWKGPTPGFNAQAAQLTEARAVAPWLAAGSQTVQQQALRDLDQAWRSFFAGAHRRPRWRKAGEHEGLRIVGPAGFAGPPRQPGTVQCVGGRRSAGYSSNAATLLQIGSRTASHASGRAVGISRSL